jgi:CheY-like chemotaxis protein
VEEIRKAGTRAAELTRQLLAFGRRQVLKPQVVDLGAALAGVERMLRRLIGEDVQLVTERCAGEVRVRVDPGQLEQVLVNLAVNARDAMADGGRLTVRTYGLGLTGDGPRPAGLPPGEYAVIEVADTGSGMTEEVRQHLFEPFFTTKEVGKGTGLDLAVSHGIVTQAAGGIDVASEPGRGSVFRVLLPGADVSSAVEARAEGAASPGALRGRTALVAEDEAALRAAVARALEGAGMRVLAAGDAEEALRLARSHAAPLDVLVADLVMPRMSGGELARHLAEAQPGLKVLFMTGFPLDPRAASAQGLGEVLQKPFPGAALVDRVRTLLQPRP